MDELDANGNFVATFATQSLVVSQHNAVLGDLQQYLTLADSMLTNTPGLTDGARKVRLMSSGGNGMEPVVYPEPTFYRNPNLWTWNNLATTSATNTLLRMYSTTVGCGGDRRSLDQPQSQQ